MICNAVVNFVVFLQYFFGFFRLLNLKNIVFFTIKNFRL